MAMSVGQAARQILIAALGGVAAVIIMQILTDIGASTKRLLTTPHGTIVMTAGDDGCRALGADWKLYADAVGRFPIATDGSQNIAAGKTGGASKYTLTIDQMPKHTHKLIDPEHTHTANSVDWEKVNSSEAQGWPRNNVHHRFRSTDRGKGSPHAPHNRDWALHASAITKARSGISMDAVGGDEEIEVMPPYIALYFCEKI